MIGIEKPVNINENLSFNCLGTEYDNEYVIEIDLNRVYSLFARPQSKDCQNE
jgi:hypothetical protein